MGPSWSRAVEDLVRNGSSASLHWEGVALRTLFQPIHGVRSAECVGYEAFVRAVDASGRAVSPKELFARAARGGRLADLDRACRTLHLRNFAMVDPGQGRLFLNVEPEAAIADLEAPRDFADLIRYYGLEPRRLCVEIVETACRDEERLPEAVACYREMGAMIAVDDFGAGCSNFQRLAALRPHLVKVERSMIAAAVGEGKSKGMLPPMIAMLRESGAQVVVERVESAPEALLAIDSGAAFLQGNYFTSPAPVLLPDDFGSQVLRKLRGLRSRGTVPAGR